LIGIPYFTHRKLVDWIVEAGTQLGFKVLRERRCTTHGKVFQIDSQWHNEQKLYAFVEAERRWEINHIISHLTCCVDYAIQENASPFFILVYLENEHDHCTRLMNTWQWLTRMLPAILKVRCLPLYTGKSETRVGLSASQITIGAFTEAMKELIRFNQSLIHSLDHETTEYNTLQQT
jgi:hypothetical protein